MRYRRSNTSGTTYFITANLADRKSSLLVDQVEILRHSIRDVKARYPFEIDAMVVSADHFHLLLTLPADDANFSTRIGAIKTGFSRRIPNDELVQPSHEKKRERGIWQRRFWEHLIRDDRDYQTHVDYIHINPVKHGYVSRASDWPFSSIHRFIKNGILDSNWGVDATGGVFGESTRSK